jgi:hypothetical protein
MKHRLNLLVLTLAAAMAGPSISFAAEPAPEPVNKGNLSFVGGVDFTTAYIFRGYVQEDQGFIAQPYLTLTAAVHKTDNMTVNAYAGIWNSLHSEQTLSDDGNSIWYESDIYGGLDFKLANGLTLGATYILYTYPNGAFNSIQALGFKIGYDDTAFTKDKIGFALNPYAGVYFETDDGNGTEDTYLEIGINPTVYSFNINPSTPVALSVPVKVGLSLDDFYVDSGGDNELFGYGQIGVAATLPLPIPTNYGAWSLTGRVDYYQFFADSTEATNAGDSWEVVGTLGVSFTY